MHEKAAAIHEKITDIQNSFWKAYKDFLQTMDVNQWSDETGRIFEKYKHDKPPYYTFCEYQLWGYSQLLSYIRVMEGTDEK